MDITSKSHSLKRHLLSTLLALMLAACGGGSSSTTSPAETSGIAAQVPVTTPSGTEVSATSTTSGQTPATTTANANSTTQATANAMTATATNQAAAKFKGVNLSGAEYANNNPTALLGWDYIYPTTTEIDYYADKGFTAIRLPFAGARVQPQNNAPLDTTELGYIQNIITYCAGKHMSVILDPHDYGMKYDSVSGQMLPLGMPGGLPASNFADFWGRLAQVFKSQSNVIFGLMNEPNMQTPTQWSAVANAAISAIRATGATQLILIPGTDYTGAFDWVSSGNAAAWTQVNDPANNFAFEVHQYLDSDNSGTHATCVTGKGATVLAAATGWARSMSYHLFLGEVGWSQDPSCTDEGPAIMNYTSANADVWSGWTYWAGGPWIPQSYIFMLDPADFTNPVDKPQMQTLLSNL